DLARPAGARQGRHRRDRRHRRRPLRHHRPQRGPGRPAQRRTGPRGDRRDRRAGGRLRLRRPDGDRRRHPRRHRPLRLRLLLGRPGPAPVPAPAPAHRPRTPLRPHHGDGLLRGDGHRGRRPRPGLARRTGPARRRGPRRGPVGPCFEPDRGRRPHPAPRLAGPAGHPAGEAGAPRLNGPRTPRTAPYPCPRRRRRPPTAAPHHPGRAPHTTPRPGADPSAFGQFTTTGDGVRALCDVLGPFTRSLARACDIRQAHTGRAGCARRGATMGADRNRREPGAGAHAVGAPFAGSHPGPLPWLRGGERHDGDTGRAVPWYLAPPAAGPGGDGLRTARPGTLGPRVADDVHRQIKGFASGGGVAPGDAIDFHITVDPPQEFGVDVYRIGHYNGHGGTKITSSPRLSGIVQPQPLTADRTVSCHHWWLSWRLQVPSYWSVGAYVAVLTTADGYRSHIPFTVRDDRPADLLLVLPDVTWQAFNLSPEDGRTGASFHHAWDEDGRLLGEADAATTVSFDRPYAGDGFPPHIGHAYDVIRWAERYGYDLAYADARDLHAGRVDPTRHRGLIFPGHDAYWSKPMRAAAESAREQGTSLVFLSAGTLYRRVELGPSPSGVPDRLLTSRKRRGPGRPVLWRESDRAEQHLL